MPEISQEELDRLTAATKERDDLKKAGDEATARAKSDKEAKEKEEKEKAEKNRREAETLDERVKREREEAEKGKSATKVLESALKFNMGVAQFVEGNKDILPTDIPEILKAAEKETYDSAPEKAAAIQTSLIKTFFAVQANVDLLTTNQKRQLDDYTKLTAGGKVEKAGFIYENIFEPALEVLKKVKKAEELNLSRQGFKGNNKTEDDYRERLIKSARKHHLHEK